MHVKSGDKIQLAVIFADFDGNAHEPSSYDVELWQTNNDTGETEQVAPSLVAGAEGKVDGYHLYEYTTPSGDYTYLWRYYTTDTDVLAQEVSEMHYSGGWVDDLAQDSDISSLINMLTNSALDLVGESEDLTIRLYAAFDEDITCNVSLDDADEIVFSVKENVDASDDDALIRLHSVDGLVRLNKTTCTSSDGTLSGSGYTASPNIKDHAIAELSTYKGCVWDIKKKVSDDWHYVKGGHLNIKAHATRDVS